MADIAVSLVLALLDRFSSFLKEEINLRNDVQTEIKDITESLDRMQAFLLDREGKGRTNMDRALVGQIRNLVYDMEDIIDEFMFCFPQHSHQDRISQGAHYLRHHLRERKALHRLSSRIHRIKEKIGKFEWVNLLQIGPTSLGEASSSGKPMNHVPDQNFEEGEIIGFQNIMRQIHKQLLSDEPRRSMLFIVGPAGSGKTVLAKKIFNDQRVRKAFDAVSWVKVSPSLDLENLFRSSELQLPGRGETDSIPLMERVRRQFDGRKYLIVLDDVWRKQDWEHILNMLPNRTLGSRVIVTSCNREVASFRVHEPGHLHELDRLSWEDAYNLFCKKVFQPTGGKCPPELHEWAERIVNKCEGLPSALATVASLLSNKPQIPVEWQKFQDSIGMDPSIIGRLLPSYNDLRAQCNLKCCFLYFGIFPEDYTIQRERLIRLWIAEGFVKKERNQSAEEVAERNLNDLVDRHLVSVCKRDIDGRIRSCQVPNLVREFIISKAEEENFFGVLAGQNSPSCEQSRRLSIIKQ